MQPLSKGKGWERIALPSSRKDIQLKGARADPFEGENSRPQNRSWKIQGERVRTKKKPGDFEEEVAMWIINYREKRPISMISEQRVAKGVQRRAEILFVNGETDESTIVDTDVRFEQPPMEVVFQESRHTRSELESAFKRRYSIWQPVW